MSYYSTWPIIYTVSIPHYIPSTVLAEVAGEGGTYDWKMLLLCNSSLISRDDVITSEMSTIVYLWY